MRSAVRRPASLCSPLRLARRRCSLLGACGDERTPRASASPSGDPTRRRRARPSADPDADAEGQGQAVDEPRRGQGDRRRTASSPKVTFKAPWAIDKTQTEVLEPRARAPMVKAGPAVEVNYYGVNGRTGKMFDESFSRGPAGRVHARPGGARLQQGPGRAEAGQPGADRHARHGRLRRVRRQPAGRHRGRRHPDLRGRHRRRAADRPAGRRGRRRRPGLPTVTDKDGKPEITVPKTDPPTDLQVQPLIKGKGKKVAETDTSPSTTAGCAWTTASCSRSPTAASRRPPRCPACCPGMVKGLTGQTVGSRVLLVIPPAEGYPDGNATPVDREGRDPGHGRRPAVHASRAQ